MDYVNKAETLARDAHTGQLDKADLPYIEHPERVAARVAEIDGRPEAIAVAWLHDVVEDTPVTLDDLRAAGFTDDVIAAVDALTRRAAEGEAYYARVAANELAAVVKQADIWDNTSPERLARLTEADRSRLTGKYSQALNLLASHSPAAKPIDDRAVTMSTPDQAPELSREAASKDPTAGDASPPRSDSTRAWKLELRNARVNNIRSHLSARQDSDGTVHFDGHDLGVPAGLVSNDTEYEYFRTVRAVDVPELVELLGGRPGDDLRELLQSAWTGAASFQLERRLRDARFPISFHSF